MDTNHRLSIRKEEMYGKIEDYLSREITQKEYCQQENLVPSTFFYWLQKYRKEHGLSSERDTKPSGFIPIKFNSDSSLRGSATDCEVHLPNGILIRCHSASINSSLVNLIQLLLD
jgi:hypothetical protein